MITILYKSKRFISSVLSLSLLLSFNSYASSPLTASQTDYDAPTTTPHRIPITAEIETPMFSVSVPTQLPIYVFADGTIAVAEDAKITNGSNKAIQVTDIEITPTDGWSLVSYDSNIDANEFAISINDKVSTDGAFEWANFKMEKETVLDLEYDIKLPESDGMALTEVGGISFIVDWYRPVYSVESTGDVRYDGKTIVTMDEPLQLTAQQTFGLRTPTWESSNPEIATVDQTGLVTALQPGAFTISYGESTFDMMAYGTPIAATRDNVNFTVTNVSIPTHYQQDGKWYTVTSVGDSAFRSITKTHNINISDTVTSIGDSAFEGSTGLAITKLPDSITSIGDNAFKKVGSIGVDLPKQLITIGVSAFEGTVYLPRSLTIPATVESWGINSFKSVKMTHSNYTTKTIYIYTTTRIPDGAFNGLVASAYPSHISLYLPRFTQGIGVSALQVNPFTYLYYGGSQQEWLSVPIDSSNTYVNSASKWYDFEF